MKKMRAPSTWAPGYAVYVRSGKDLTAHGILLSGLIYIGEARRMERRGPLQDHYSGSCSFRRTLGALLKEELGLRPVPSGTGKTNRDCINYCFTFDDEMKLTDWIEQNLEVRPLPLGDNRGGTRSNRAGKRDAIRSMQPALCLTGWRNPYVTTLRALRRACADQARAAKAAPP
ncbi:MAG: hypothetical protein Q7T82_13635 [Armatimonadota bacterium]|nr:hypothetical protein [Armatimonadota bacterium]